MTPRIPAPTLRPRRPPIVITGVHRAGTTVVTSALSDLGLFVGARLDPNAESEFFQELNEWVLDQAGAVWDRPGAVHDLLADPSLRTLVVDYLALSVQSPRSFAYLGPLRWARARWPGGLDESWGWKDPRTTFTWPLWERLFPEAKVIHVFRHGVDVASSLTARTEKTRVELAERYARGRSRFRFRARTGGFVDSIRCTTLEGAFSLWEEYADEGRRHLDAAPDRSIAVHYEDLLKQPQEHLERLAAFAGLDASAARVRTVAERFDTARAHAYVRDERLVEFARAHETRLEARGYAADTGGP